MKRVKVLLFATLRDYVGERSLEIELPEEATVASLEEMLIARYPSLERLRGMILVAVNHHYAAPNQVIPADAEVALFPPVSGG